MYGYHFPIDITPDHILQKVTQEQIFEAILKQPFNWAFRYTSPCRQDKKPGCRFESREDGTILFVDFGERYLTGRTHRTCFRLAMDTWGVDYESSIKRICEHFNLPMTPNAYSEVKIETYTRKVVEAARSSISYIAKDYGKIDIRWWSQFLIKTEELKQDNVFVVKQYTVNSPTKGTRTFNPFKYCYVIDFLDAVKIYQPYQTDYKWITNCNEDHIGNIDNLSPSGDRLIIQKSYKDHRVVRNVLGIKDVVWFMNEGCVPSEYILRMFLDRFRELVVFYDNDEDGIIAGTKLVEAINSIKPSSSHLIHLPVVCRTKDPAEFVAREGRQDTFQLLKSIGL